MKRFLLPLALFAFLASPMFAVDITVTAANVDPASDASLNTTDTSGATLTAGMVVYKDTSALTWKIAHCETSAATATVGGIVVTGSSANQPCVIQTAGGIDMGATLTIGTIYVLSTAGLIAPAADLASNDWVTVIGVATAADNLKLGINVSAVQVP